MLVVDMNFLSTPDPESATVAVETGELSIIKMIRWCLKNVGVVEAFGWLRAQLRLDVVKFLVQALFLMNRRATLS